MTQNHILQLILSFDHTYRGYMESLRNPFLNDIVLAITHIGDPVVLFLITACILLALWMNKKSVEVIVFAGAMFGGVAIVWLAKHSIARPRPIGIITETGYSFPSGHALVASIFFPFMIYLIRRFLPVCWKRRILITTLIVLMSIIILSRPYIGVHYLSDVMAGFLVGILISSFAILIVEGYHQRISSKIN